jgi:hypothetical protein
MRIPTVSIGVVALLFALLRAGPTHAEPPPGTDLNGELHHWFERQHSVGGAWCCTIADGHILDDDDWRTARNGYEVRVRGAWLPVPNDALRDPSGGDNPTGKAVVWYSRFGEPPRIYCFCPGWEM